VSRSRTFRLLVSEVCRVCLVGKGVAFIALCRGVEILSASECGLLSMSSCVILTFLEKVIIIGKDYWLLLVRIIGYW